MTIFRVLGKSVVTTVRGARMLAVLWVVNAAFALLLLAPFNALVRSDLGASLLGRAVRGFDMLWLGGALYRFREIGPAVGAWFLAAVLMYLAVSVFLDGGIAGRVVALEGGGLGGFFADCGRLFGRFVRVVLVSIPLFLVVVGLVSRLASAVAGLFTRNAASEWTVIIASNAAFLVALLAVTAVQMALDYTRVRIAAEDRRGVVRAFLDTFRFLGPRFFPAWAIYLAISLLPIAAGVGLLLLQRRFPGGLLGLAVGFVAAQVFIGLRLVARVMFLGSAYHYTQAAQGQR